MVTILLGGTVIMIGLFSERVRRTGQRAIAASIRKSFLVGCAALLVVCGNIGNRVAQAHASTHDTIPTGLSTEEWHHIQQVVERATYQVREGAPTTGDSGALEATNVRHKLRMAFTPDGVRIIPTSRGNQDWQWGMTLRAYGYEGHTVNVEAVQPMADGNRVEYRRGNMVE